MWQVLKNRWRQGFRTAPYPDKEPDFPERFRGRPVPAENGPGVDLGKSLFNEDALQDRPPAVIGYSRDYRMAVSRREDLLLMKEGLKLAGALDQKIKKLYGRSLKLRAVCAGSCNGCDSEVQALGNVVFDLSRFGIQFVASPRHADGLLVTGMVTRNMETALKKTYEAVPDPRIVIALGACALSGGPFAGSPQTRDGVDGVIPVDLYVPGCPPHPYTILDGLLRLLGKLKEKTPGRKS
ncbi:MAG: NADH-quinone oxidoreductase subunit NuoB [Candidatus Omnitrophica bacterium]|nr:NADH-quinone oxidoreductase subunit NuoB [Candidatus Omnitrophota bacterium]